MPPGPSIATLTLVELASASERLMGRWSRMRSVDIWVMDALLATAFVILSLVGHFAAGGSSGVEYRDPNVLSVLLTLGASVPYYFRRRAPLAVLFVSAVSVVILTVGNYQTGAAPSLLIVG